MTTQNVKNNHDSPLSIGGVLIAPGRAMPIPNWERVSKTGPVKAFLAAGAIEEDGKSVSQELPNGNDGGSGSAPDAAEDAEKERIIGELREHGIEKTKRTSLDNLRKELETAKAAKSGTPAPAGSLPGTGGTPAPTGGLPGVPAAS